MEEQNAKHASFYETREALTRFLFVQDEPAPVDLCFVLGSSTVSSMQPAIDLYLKGQTRKILISGHGPSPDQKLECEIFKAHALANGVAEEAILLERRASNTLENFIFSRPIIGKEVGWKNIQNVAIAGKPFHMRRALMTARMHWPARLRLLMLPSNHPDDVPAESWWQSEYGRKFVLAELSAIGSYALQGHLGGF
jgi:uncharacterized SAM-binding protein YcdF (DUF218 family)